jgi:hypothetical protein
MRIETLESCLGGNSMDLTALLLFSLFFSFFSYLVVIARTRRQMLSVALAGVLVAALVAPPPAQAQSLWGSINSVLNVINGAIKNALNTIQSIQTSIRDFYQKFTWPISLINQAKALVTQMVNQYRALMQRIFDMDLRSATLPNPKALEDIMRNRQTNDFANLVTSFRNTYGSLPPVTAASPPDRMMMDMDDAMVLSTLKMLKTTDAAADLTLQAANDIENEASQAAPGSAPFLTASATVASIQSQALTQKMLAAELRQEAARLAHENALRKQGVALTDDVKTQIQNLLKRN